MVEQNTLLDCDLVEKPCDGFPLLSEPVAALVQFRFGKAKAAAADTSSLERVLGGFEDDPPVSADRVEADRLVLDTGWLIRDRCSPRASPTRSIDTACGCAIMSRRVRLVEEPFRFLCESITSDRLV